VSIYLRPDVSFGRSLEEPTDNEGFIRLKLYWDFGSRYAIIDVTDDVHALLDAHVGGAEPLPDIAYLSDSAQQFIRFLHDRSLVTTQQRPFTGRWSRQLPVWMSLHAGQKPQDVQDRVHASRVAVLGLGGIGSNITLELAASGVRQFYLLDSDIVTDSNQNRQIPFLSKDALGAGKAAYLSSYLAHVADIHSDQIAVSGDKITSDSLRHLLDWAPDLIIVAADEPSLFVNVVEVIDNAPDTPVLVGGGYFGLTCFAGPLLVPGERPCSTCLREFFLPTSRAGTNAPVGGSIASVALTATSLSATSCLLFLSGVEPDKLPLHNSVLELTTFPSTLHSVMLRRCATCATETY